MVDNKTTEISLNVKSQDGNIICFKLKRTTVLRKLMETYCTRNGVIINF